MLVSTVALVWQCCHRFFSVCDQSSSTFFFCVCQGLALRLFSSTVPCWLFCLASVCLVTRVSCSIERPEIVLHGIVFGLQ